MCNNKTVPYNVMAHVFAHGVDLRNGPETPRGWKGQSAVLQTTSVNEKLLSSILRVQRQLVDGRALLTVTTAKALNIVLLKPASPNVNLKRNSPFIVVGNGADHLLMEDDEKLYNLYPDQKDNVEVEGVYHVPQGFKVQRLLTPSPQDDGDPPFFGFQVGFMLRDDLNIAELTVTDDGALLANANGEVNVYAINTERNDRYIRAGVGQVHMDGKLLYHTVHECEERGAEITHSVDSEGNIIDKVSSTRGILEILFGKETVQRALD